MSIKSNIQTIKQRMFSEIDNQGDRPFCDKIQTMALAAIHDGRESDAWKTYMKLFADDAHPEQLARLLATDGTDNNDVMNQKRAYLVADGTCTTETVSNFGKNASAALDVGLPQA